MSTTSSSIFNAVYDYRSRRLEKTENSSTVKYLYDGGVSVLEYDSQGSLTKVLVRGSGYGGGIGSVIYTADDINGTNRRFFLYNALGSTSAMTNDAMTVTSTSSYDGWGKEVNSTGSNETDRKFCTKERSASIGLDYFGFRYYDYDLGRFTTRDPSGYPDGLNNYLYCNNDPVNKIDPLGLMTESQFNKQWEEHYENNSKKYKNFQTGPGKLIAKYAYKQELGSQGYTIYSDDFSKVLQKSTRKDGPRKSVFAILGGNKKDPSLFERMSEKQINLLKKKGYDVNVLDVNEKTDYFDGEKAPKRNIAKIIKNGLKNIRNLSRLQFYVHGGADMNIVGLPNRAGTILHLPSSDSTISKYQINVNKLKIGHPNQPRGAQVDIFSCGAPLEQAFAKALGVWRVRHPGWANSVYSDNGWPKAKVAGSWGGYNKKWFMRYNKKDKKYPEFETNPPALDK